MIVRAAALSDKIKYWIKPDLENRIKEGSIRASSTRRCARSARRRSWSTRRRASARSRTTGCSRRPAITPISIPRALGLEFARRRVPDADLRRGDVRDDAAGRLHRGHGLRRLSDEPLVHRERPLPRAADRQAHRQRPRRASSVRSHSLEDRSKSKGRAPSAKGTRRPARRADRLDVTSRSPFDNRGDVRPRRCQRPPSKATVCPSGADGRASRTRSPAPRPLASDQLAAAADVVLHPGGHQQVVGVALHLADVEGQRRHHVAQVLRR